MDPATRSGSIAVCDVGAYWPTQMRTGGKVLSVDRLVFCMGGRWRASVSSSSTSKPSSTRSVVFGHVGGGSLRASGSAWQLGCSSPFYWCC